MTLRAAAMVLAGALAATVPGDPAVAPAAGSDPTAPERQSTAQSDLALTRRIREALLKDDSLSAYAKNVEIMTRDGVVTLSGQATEEERKTILARARQVAPKGPIVDEIEVPSEVPDP